MTTTKKNIGASVKNLRKKAGIITQEALGKKINPTPLSKETINRIEVGRTNYGIDALFKIAEVLGVDVLDFFEDKRIGPEFTKENLEDLKYLLKMFGATLESYKKGLKKLQDD